MGNMIVLYPPITPMLCGCIWVESRYSDDEKAISVPGNT